LSAIATRLRQETATRGKHSVLVCAAAGVTSHRNLSWTTKLSLSVRGVRSTVTKT
jgi:hypothetical protein